MKEAIVIGASSGIGREPAKILFHNNYIVGLAARRVDLLSTLQREITAKTYIKRIDVSNTEEAKGLLEELVSEMGGMDLVVISSGVGFINPDLDWEKEKETIEVNVTGFMAMANVAFKHFLKQGSDHIVGISSIAALRGGGESPANNKRKHAYITKRWRVIAWLLKIMPDWVCNRL